MFTTQSRGIFELSHHENLYRDVVMDALKSGGENVNLLKAYMVTRIIEQISYEISNEQSNIQDAVCLLVFVITAFVSVKD